MAADGRYLVRSAADFGEAPTRGLARAMENATTRQAWLGRQRALATRWVAEAFEPPTLGHHVYATTE